MGPRCTAQMWRARAPARTVLFFGPHGCCKALLGHCLTTRLGATLRLCGADLAASSAFKGARLLKAAFVAARPPGLLLITKSDALLLPAQDDSTPLRARPLTYLDPGCGERARDGMLAVGTTLQPAAQDEATRWQFALCF